MHIFLILWPIYEKLVIIFIPLLYVFFPCLLCDEVLLPWYFRSPGFDVRAPQDPPNMKKTYIFFHILCFNYTILCQIASLFDMYIYMGERIAGKQDRHSLIIEHPLSTSQLAQNIQFFFYILAHTKNVYEKLVFKLFPFVVHMSPLWWGLYLLIFRCTCYPWILCKGPTWPRFFF